MLNHYAEQGFTVFASTSVTLNRKHSRIMRYDCSIEPVTELAKK